MIKIVGRIGYIAVLLLVLMGLSSLVARFVDTMHVLAVGPPPPEQTNVFEIRYQNRPWLTLAHLVPGFFFMVLGPLQFLPIIRKRWLSFHRWSGRVFLVAAFLSAVTALVFLPMLPMFGTFTAKAGTALGSAIFLVSIAMAYVTIRQKKVQQHREWMIRAFALGLGISTFRLLIPILMSPPFRLSFPETWDTVVWLGFSLNLLVAEVWINITRPSRTTRRVTAVSSKWNSPAETEPNVDKQQPLST